MPRITDIFLVGAEEQPDLSTLCSEAEQQTPLFIGRTSVKFDGLLRLPIWKRGFFWLLLSACALAGFYAHSHAGVNDFDIPRVLSQRDTNGNGVNDTDDIIAGARAEVDRKPLYHSEYHAGGYPPETEGVCTDVIWRAFKDAGYDLRNMIDQDIRQNRANYPQISTRDSNIDFRRVPNLISFFKKHGKILTTEIVPRDPDSLNQWQPGDLVTFTNPNHIAILSDKRNADGIPLLLHNDGPAASESDRFMYWYERGITGHFRFPPD